MEVKWDVRESVVVRIAGMVVHAGVEKLAGTATWVWEVVTWPETERATGGNHQTVATGSSPHRGHARKAAEVSVGATVAALKLAESAGQDIREAAKVLTISVAPRKTKVAS